MATGSFVTQKIILVLKNVGGKLIDHVVSRLEPQILDYVEVRHPRNTANLLQIVDKYEERFMHRQIRGLFSDQPGLTHVVYHEIDTGDKGPVVSRPYKYDRVKQGIIDYHIDKMLRDGTICPINLPYASPVVLTRKKNDLPPDSPRRIISEVAIFSWRLVQRDIEKTAFITRNGTFAFLRMPFGLSGAPSFQRAIDIILQPVIGRFVPVYMDDVIITSPSFKDHLGHLTQVLPYYETQG
ncbi:retrovirus-related Pol polyprotein from transposon opus [Trichonephila clavipes]|nr:retrovirus-related Pol polyprotein from transposon opus [Trichonephila clavipes]